MPSLLLRSSRRLAACGLLLGSSGLFAQTQTAAPAGGEAVKLQPFQVSEGSLRGYGASETMTGTRMAMQIIDLPYSVNVLTNDFTKDFGMFELADNITQVSNFTGLDIGGNFMLRGFNSSQQLRDGFLRSGRYGSSNIDRIEVIKGSNAAIYGRTSPGGMINMISKQPKSAAAAQELSLNFGDYGTQRATLELTGPLLQTSLGKTNYLLTASHYQRDFDQDFARNRNQEYYFALNHVFTDGSKLTLTNEFFLQERHAPTVALPLVVDQKGTTSTADDVAVGYAFNLGNYNALGPVAELNRGFRGITAVYEKTINPVFSTRTSGHWFAERRWDYNNNTGWGTLSLNTPVAANSLTSARGAVPNRGRIFVDGGSLQSDLLANYWTNSNQIEHRTLFTIDINDWYRWDPTLSWAGATNPDLVAWNAVRTVKLDASFNPVAPIAYFPKRSFESPGELATRTQKLRITTVGLGLRQQSAMLNGRLLAYAGARYDYIRYRHRDFITAASAFTPFIPGYAPGQAIKKSGNELKPTAGLNYKVTPAFRVFANYSQSWFITQGDGALIVADPTYKSESAGGYDYGFKGSFLNDRLNYTVSGFYADRHNVSVVDLVESPVGSGNYVTVTQRTGDQLVRGYEADVTWNINKEVFLNASYGRVNSIYTDFGSSFPAAIGRNVQFVAPYNGSVSFKYAPEGGRLKGFSTNLGVTFVGATPTELPTAGDVYATQPGGKRVVTQSTGQWALKAPAYRVWSFGMRYRLQTGSSYSHTLAVNVNNLTDETYLRAGSAGANSRYPGEKRAVYFTYTLSRRGGGAF
jgi:outer membrane receptor protein involved in Fe transport